MQDDYRWKGGEVSSSTYHTPRSEGAGKWVFLALVFALIIHAAVIWGFSRMDFVSSKGLDEMDPQPEVVRVRRMAYEEPVPEAVEPVAAEIAEQEAMEIEEPADEIDMLEEIVNVDVDILPDVEMMQVPMSEAVLAGAFEEETFEPMQAPVFDPEMPKMGLTDDLLPHSDGGDLIVDPGARMAEEYDPDEYTESLRKGAGGESEDALFKDFTSLDTMARMDGNALQASKALIGSDLLFDFGSAKLRQSARVSLMKVALLIDKNPKLVCWVDGHTDLIGRDDRNLILSQERAMAVKTWLVDTLDMDADRVAVSGYGKSNPLILSGTAEEQAGNRRVEIKMRKGRPKNETKGTKDVAKEKPAKSAKRAVKNNPEPLRPATTPRAIVVDENKPIVVKPKISKAESLEKLGLGTLPEPALPQPANEDSLDAPKLRPLPKFRDFPAIPLSEDLPMNIDELELPEVEEIPRAIPVEE